MKCVYSTVRTIREFEREAEKKTIEANSIGWFVIGQPKDFVKTQKQYLCTKGKGGVSRRNYVRG
jgi:hypothetical protein